MVLKAQSADLPHKSDAGGVVLSIKDAMAMTEGWARLHANLARSRPNIKLDGVLVEHMSEPGVELIVGGRNDAAWGPLVLSYYVVCIIDDAEVTTGWVFGPVGAHSLQWTI